MKIKIKVKVKVPEGSTCIGCKYKGIESDIPYCNLFNKIKLEHDFKLNDCSVKVIEKQSKYNEKLYVRMPLIKHDVNAK